eukprot:jgi/Chrzof1/13202/Cz07g24080.t1
MRLYIQLSLALTHAGVGGCLLLSILLAAWETFTMYVLAKFAERYSSHSYGNLIRKALGKKLSGLLSAILVVYLWGSCVAYLIIIGDTFSSLGTLHFGAASILANRHIILVTIGLGIILPMCFARNLSALEWVSLGAVVGFVYTSAAIVTRGVQIVQHRDPPFEGVNLFVWDISALYAVSIIVFGFNSHANVVSIFQELEQYPHRILTRLPSSPARYQNMSSLAPKPYTYKLIGMLGVILSAMAIIFAGYMSVGCAGYLAFPKTVTSNILNDFSQDDILIQIARCVIGVVVVGHYPLNHHPARQGYEDLLIAMFGFTVLPSWVSMLCTIVFVASSVAVSLVVSDLGSVLHLIGGTAASFMIFFLPGLLLMNAAIIKQTNSFSNLEQLDAAEVGSEASVPLLVEKKAGIRESGLIYSPRKSWWSGLALIILSALVLAVTLLTAAAG